MRPPFMGNRAQELDETASPAGLTPGKDITVKNYSTQPRSLTAFETRRGMGVQDAAGGGPAAEWEMANTVGAIKVAAARDAADRRMQELKAILDSRRKEASAARPSTSPKEASRYSAPRAAAGVSVSE